METRHLLTIKLKDLWNQWNTVSYWYRLSKIHIKTVKLQFDKKNLVFFRYIVVPPGAIINFPKRTVISLCVRSKSISRHIKAFFYHIHINHSGDIAFYYYSYTDLLSPFSYSRMSFILLGVDSQEVEIIGSRQLITANKPPMHQYWNTPGTWLGLQKVTADDDGHWCVM